MQTSRPQAHIPQPSPLSNSQGQILDNRGPLPQPRGCRKYSPYPILNSLSVPWLPGPCRPTDTPRQTPGHRLHPVSDSWPSRVLPHGGIALSERGGGAGVGVLCPVHVLDPRLWSDPEPNDWTRGRVSVRKNLSHHHCMQHCLPPSFSEDPYRGFPIRAMQPDCGSPVRTGCTGTRWGVGFGPRSD